MQLKCEIDKIAVCGQTGSVAIGDAEGTVTLVDGGGGGGCVVRWAAHRGEPITGLHFGALGDTLFSAGHVEGTMLIVWDLRHPQGGMFIRIYKSYILIKNGF